jgi:hypothetical protein
VRHLRVLSANVLGIAGQIIAALLGNGVIGVGGILNPCLSGRDAIILRSQLVPKNLACLPALPMNLPATRGGSWAGRQGRHCAHATPQKRKKSSGRLLDTRFSPRNAIASDMPITDYERASLYKYMFLLGFLLNKPGPHPAASTPRVHTAD